MIDSPKVSVLIPAYNAAPFLDEAIQSVLAQTFSDFELIIVDNHSTDNTDEVVSKYLNDERVSFFKNEVNLGMIGNWNKCLRLAKGEYIKYLCADDKFHPELLEKYVKVMEEYPSVALVTCFKTTFGAKSEYHELPFKFLQDGKKVMFDTLYHHNWIGEPTLVMFRRSNLYLGEFTPELTWCPDWEMWLKHLTVGDCYIVPEALSFIRNHSTQVTKMIMKNYINYFEEYQLCKSVKTVNKYKVDLTQINMDGIIKKKAKNCAKAMLKVMFKLHKKNNRKIFFKALKIAYKEKVILTTFLGAIKNRVGNKKVFEQTARLPANELI